MKIPPSKHRPRRRRARPLLVAVASTAVLASACSTALGSVPHEPSDLAVQDQGVVGTSDLGFFGVPDLGTFDLPNVDGTGVEPHD